MENCVAFLTTTPTGRIRCSENTGPWVTVAAAATIHSSAPARKGPIVTEYVPVLSDVKRSTRLSSLRYETAWKSHTVGGENPEPPSVVTDTVTLWPGAGGSGCTRRSTSRRGASAIGPRVRNATDVNTKVATVAMVRNVANRRTE
jgi:hypothetical protein